MALDLDSLAKTEGESGRFFHDPRKAEFSMGPQRRTAVLLDHHPLWLEAVEAVLLRSEYEIVGRTGDPEEAIELLEEHRPDVYVVEVESVDGDVDLGRVRDAVRTAPGTRVLVLSALCGSTVVDDALDAGAAAYVVKTAHPDDLTAAIRQTFEHSVYLAGDRRASEPRPVQVEAATDLTRRELEILKLVAEGHSNAGLARMLWVTEQTVKFHLSNIYRKLNVANRTEASRWAQLHGLLDATVREASANGRVEERAGIAGMTLAAAHR
jgi:DNA-binding NarL/FixJ family response regulator